MILRRGRARGRPAARPRYDAFLSYSHALDGTLAPAVQKCLHQLARRWYRPRALRVFQDKTSLSATPDLWGEIEQALAQSRYFILLASPPAATSSWVARELDRWKDHDHELKRLLIVLTDGEIAWDRDRADFDWSRTTALPAPVAGWFTAEPLWVDLRWARKENLSVRHSRFRQKIAALAAPIHGTSPDALESEDLRQHRRFRRITWAVAAALAVLLVLAITGGVAALVQRNRAVDRQQAAEAAQLRATVEGLLGRADAVREADPRTALRLGLAADELSPSSRTRSNLLDTLAGTPHLDASTPDVATQGEDTPGGVDVGPARSVAFSGDGTVVAVGHREGTTVLWDVADPPAPRLLGEAVDEDLGEVSSVAFTGDGRTMATGDVHGTVILWDVADRTSPRRSGALPGGSRSWVRSMAFTPDGHTLATVEWPATTGAVAGAVTLWDVGERSAPRRLGVLEGQTGFGAHSLAFTADGNTLATTGGDDGVILWDVSDPAAPRRLGTVGDTTAHVFSVAFSADGRTLATGGDGSVLLWDVAEPAAPRILGDPLTGHTGYVFAAAFAPDGKTLATAGADTTVLLWDTSDPAHPRLSARPLTGHTNYVWSLAFTNGGTALLSGSADGTMIRWNMAGPAAPHPVGLPLAGHTGRVNTLAFTADGDTLATAGADTTALWDTSDPAHPHRLGDPLEGHTGPVSSVAFTADGDTLAAASTDNTVLLWDTSDPAPTGSAIPSKATAPISRPSC